jgi:hypothetical protein
VTSPPAYSKTPHPSRGEDLQPKAGAPTPAHGQRHERLLRAAGPRGMGRIGSAGWPPSQEGHRGVHHLVAARS